MTSMTTPPKKQAPDTLRTHFEALASDPSFKLRRSRRGTYVNPAVARDWKWFQLGAGHAQQPAPSAAHGVADALADSQYLAGVSAGWNAANADDPNAALQQLHESRAGYLKPLSAARAPADSVMAPAGDALRAQVASLTRDCGRQASKIAELIADLKFQEGKHREDSARLQTLYEHQRGECWYWQGDGQDHLESLCNTLPVVIRADQLRALASTPPTQAANSALEDKAQLEQIAEAIRDYHHALDMRKHGGLAESAAFSSICQTMGMHWRQGEETVRRAARTQGGEA